MAGNTTDGKTRETWPSRTAFYFAAVGAAVGFGNVWRFPALSVEYGGGAFFIPYLMALFLIGIPILILEIGFGQFFQSGDVGVFGGFHPRLRGVGVASVACGFMLVVYYSMLIAWVVNAFFDSFGNNDPWGAPDISGEEAVEYFTNVIIGAETLGQDGRPTRLVGANVGYSFLVWVIVFFGIGFGVQWTGRISYVTMGLPVILLFVFLGRSLTLEGSSEGVKEYIGRWDVSVLTERGDVWSTAVSQIFFSLGVTFGIMTAFGSYCPHHEPVVLNSFVISIANSMFSFISGFAVFAALGHLSFLSGTSVTDLPFAGFSLVFGTWPVVLGSLSGGEHWVRLLFFNLFLLGIDSAFGFTEGVVTVLLDTTFLQHLPKWKVTAAVCLVGWLLSLMYATDAGLNFLDVIDFYINFVMLFVGFGETFSAGWVYGHKKMIDNCGAPAVFSYMIANFGCVIVACGIWFGVSPDDGGVWGGFVGMFLFYFIGITVTCFFLKKKMDENPGKWTWSEMLWEVSFRNIFDLKARIEPIVQWIPSLWCVLIKQFIPHILIILFINLAQSNNADGEPIFGHYGGYGAKPFQIMGVLTWVFALVLFLVGAVFPALYQSLDLPAGHLALDEAEALEKKEHMEGSSVDEVSGSDQENDGEGIADSTNKE
jgi:solute carrier family 6 GABA transporter-like protein 1